MQKLIRLPIELIPDEILEAIQNLYTKILTHSDWRNGVQITFNDTTYTKLSKPTLQVDYFILGEEV